MRPSQGPTAEEARTEAAGEEPARTGSVAPFVVFLVFGLLLLKLRVGLPAPEPLDPGLVTLGLGAIFLLAGLRGLLVFLGVRDERRGTCLALAAAWVVLLALGSLPASADFEWLPDLAGWLPVLQSLAWIAALLVAIRVLADTCRERGRERAASAWRLAFVAGAVVWGAFLALEALGAIAVQVGARVQGKSNSLLLLALVSLVRALPAVPIVRAAGWTLVEDRPAAPRLGRVLLHPGAPVAVLLLLLAPVWLFLPAWWHYTHTPDFDTYVASLTVSDARLSEIAAAETLSDPTAGEAEAVTPELDAEDRFHGGHQFLVTLRHGETLLLDLIHEVVASVDTVAGRPVDVRVHTPRLRHDPRFRPVVLTDLRLDVPLPDLEPEVRDDGTRVWTIPCDANAYLLAGEGEPLARARRVAKIANDPVPASTGLWSLLWLLESVGFEAFDPLPEEGLIYRARSRFVIRVSQRPAAEGGGWTANSELHRPRFTVNTREYSHDVALESRGWTGSRGEGGSLSVRVTLTADRRWNGEVW